MAGLSYLYPDTYRTAVVVPRFFHRGIFISCDLPVNTIISNIQTHLYLGNEKCLAPKLLQAKTGDCYICDQGYRFYLMETVPDFAKLDQCYVHTDMGPHNAILDQDGRVIFIDLDDAGIGSRYLILGWPLIMQFVNFDHDT